MTARTPTGETPFRLVFGIAHYDEGRNEEGIRLHLDLLDEVWAIVE